MQSFKNKYYVTNDDIYLINKFSILVGTGFFLNGQYRGFCIAN